MQPIIPSQHQYPGTTTPNQHIGVDNDRGHSRELNIVSSSCAKSSAALPDQQNTAQLPEKNKKRGRPPSKSKRWESNGTKDWLSLHHHSVLNALLVLDTHPPPVNLSQAVCATVICPTVQPTCTQPIHAPSAQRSTIASLISNPPPHTANSSSLVTNPSHPAAKSSLSFRSIHLLDHAPTTTTTTARRQKIQCVSQHSGDIVDCKGVHKGNFGHALNFTGKVMLNTGHKLIKIVMEPDAGLVNTATSTLAKYDNEES